MNWYLFIRGVFVALGGTVFGYDTAVNGVKDMVAFREAFNLSLPTGVNDVNDSSTLGDVETSAILGAMVSVYSAGAVVGALVGGPISDAAGRRTVYIVGAAIYTVGGILQTAAFHIWMIFIGRILTGVATGIILLAIPVYIAEISPKETRGRFVVFSGTSAAIGTLAPAVFNVLVVNYLPTYGWRVVLGVQPLIGAILVVGMIFLPETPRWLAKKGRDEKALAVLKKVYKLEEKACAELKEIKGTIIDTSFKELLQLLCKPKMIRRVLLGFILFLLGRFCGIAIVKYYSVTVFNSVGIEGFIATLVLGVMFVVASFLSVLAVDKFGRKAILLVGAVVMFLALSISATLVLTLGDITAVGYIIVILLMLFGMTFAFSFSIIPWVINSEIFPLRLRGMMVALSSLAQWLGTIIVAQLVPVLLSSSLQTHGTFFLFAGAQIVAFLYVLLLISRDKSTGLSLEKIEVLFSKPWLERVNLFYYLRCGCLYECCKRKTGTVYSITSPIVDPEKFEEELKEMELQTAQDVPIYSNDIVYRVTPL